MPIYEIVCQKCGVESEVLVPTSKAPLICPSCGSLNTSRLMSATSSRTGKDSQTYPGPQDTACCGSTPAQANCAGPGSCCGKSVAKN
jgi:putative FmdB family regulatory protein